jgi:hypothetical protein
MRFDEEFGAVFYLEPPDDPEPAGWQREQIERIGVSGLVPVTVELPGGGEKNEVGHGRWNEFPVDVHDIRLDYFRAFALTYSARRFYVLRREGRRAFEEAFIADFRDACLRVEADAAFVTQLTEPPVERLAVDFGLDLTGRDLRALVDRNLGLLFLGEKWFPDLDYTRLDPRREEVPVEGGRLLAWHEELRSS